MHDALAAVSRAAAVPTPTPTVDPNLVSPGPWGFAIIVFLAAAVIVLIWDMMRRIRRGRVRADIAEELDAEQRAADGEHGAGPRESGPDEGTGPDGGSGSGDVRGPGD